MTRIQVARCDWIRVESRSPKGIATPTGRYINRLDIKQQRRDALLAGSVVASGTETLGQKVPTRPLQRLSVPIHEVVPQDVSRPIGNIIIQVRGNVPPGWASRPRETVLAAS